MNDHCVVIALIRGEAPCQVALRFQPVKANPA